MQRLNGRLMVLLTCPTQMLSFMHAQYSLFHQGYNLLDELDPYMKKLAAEVSKASSSLSESSAVISTSILSLSERLESNSHPLNLDSRAETGRQGKTAESQDQRQPGGAQEKDGEQASAEHDQR